MYITAAAAPERFVAPLHRVINAEGVSRERPKAAEGLCRGNGLVLTFKAQMCGGFLCSLTGQTGCISRRTPLLFFLLFADLLFHI